MKNDKIAIRKIRHSFMINRIISLLVLAVCICTIVGISICPTNEIIVNILVYVLSGSLALKEVWDLIRNHIAETNFERKLSLMFMMMSVYKDNEEDEWEEEE